MGEFLKVISDNPVDSFAALVACISAFIAWRANKKSDKANDLAEEANNESKQANELAKDANDLANSANSIASKANEIASETLSIEKRKQLVFFDVISEDIRFGNDAYNCSTIEEALQVGTIICKLQIENKSEKDALHVRPEKDSQENMIDIPSGKSGHITSMHPLRKVQSQPIYDIKIGEKKLEKKEYEMDIPIYWISDSQSYTCDITIRIVLKQKENEKTGTVTISMYQLDYGYCKISKPEEIEE